MSEAGRYHPVFERLWRHPGFRALSPSSRLLALYLISGPQTNRIGLFPLSIATAAEHLNVSAKSVRRGLTDVANAFDWHFDDVAGVFFMPSWWKWNRPQNPNHLSGNLKDLSEIPPCELVDAFAGNRRTLPDTFHQTFLAGIAERVSTRLPKQQRNQEQDQEQHQRQEQDQQLETRKAGATPRHSSRGADRPNDNVSVIVRLVHEVLETKGPGYSFSDLADTVKARCAQLHIAYDSEAVGKAIEAAEFHRKRRAAS